MQSIPHRSLVVVENYHLTADGESRDFPAFAYSGFEPYADSPRIGSPDSSKSDSPLLKTPRSPFPYSPALSTRRVRRSARSSRVLWLAVTILAGAALLIHQHERPEVRLAAKRMQSVASKVAEQRCRYMSWLSSCPDPFANLRFEEDHGEILYPALPADLSARTDVVPPQPHPIHHLIREAEFAWHRKVSRQSRTLEQAVAEYRRRYNQPPPRGFDAWFRFAQSNNVQLLDEYDSIYERILPFAALSPEVLQERSAVLQNVTGEEEYWIHQHTATIKLRHEDGVGKLEAEGPGTKANPRAEQMMALLEGVKDMLPDLNITITSADVPWIVLSGAHKQMHEAAAQAGKFLDDKATFKDNWDLDGWQVICPPQSPLQEAEHFEKRMDWQAPEKTSFIGLDHVKAMDVCQHPENQAIHGFTAWPGPRPGFLFPLFSFTTSSLHSDLLLPPLEQYEAPVGPDLPWALKKHDKALWRGSTTGSDLTQPHARKYSQRVRLAKLPYATGQLSIPLAAHDRPGSPSRVESQVIPTMHLTDEFLDVKFAGWPAQCGTEQECASLEREFEFDGFMPVEEQNQYKYVIDVDGNGWSGRFHRLMVSNSLVLKSTIFPEWYSDRIQPWVHYVPVKTDYTDLLPIIAFFKGSPYDGSGGHDELAEKVASAGKQWTEQNWRWVDMQAYLLRLLLEYARVMNRDDKGTMDYVA
ncbi:hypothetical protein NBRC10512_005802 [Rhodotorula toruloides]|uniref:RHTO0S21e01926g1_1 n=2 Tax=Rhodotorula toruloides TaxID=5286 RepID=A0A061BPE2_RHOTO|nr:glycosyltransferase family 90 protein [Rhodotorula toruloides NP11]EMS18752.1 glycosyltransferase family 90 protein [Rhodotorula toruloides NP11]CDR48932.1 RHTO0S21e01926g1_1 [Rhodotorula toruloides]